MKHSIINRSIARWVLGLCSIILFSACAPKITSEPNFSEEQDKLQGFFLNSVLEVDIREEREDREDILKEIQMRVQDIEQKMSLRVVDSEVVQINENAGIKAVSVSDDTFEVVRTALKYSDLSGGAFDISVGNLVQLWGIGTDNEKVPTDQEIRQALSTVNYKSIELNEADHSVFLKENHMSIDLGAIAKGYAADVIHDILSAHQVKTAIINLAGNIYVHGDKNGVPFKVGIQNPYQSHGEFLGIYQAADCSVVTSGIYERYFEKDGKRYHHILSTTTGYPVDNNLIAVSIISKKSMDGDALSTSAFALGLEKGMELINRLDEVEAIFIDRDKNIYLSDGAKKHFELTNSEFRVVWE